MKPLSMAARLRFGFLLVAVLPLFGLGWLSLDAFERAVKETVDQNIAALADRKALQIADFIDETMRDVGVAASQGKLRRAVEEIGAAFARRGLAGAGTAATKYRDELLAFHHESERFHDVLLIDAAGNVVFSVKHEADLGTNLNHGPYRDSSLGIAYQRSQDSLATEVGPFLPHAPSGNAMALFVVAPIFRDGTPQGAIAVQVNLSALSGVFAERVDLRTSGRVVVGNLDPRASSGVAMYPPNDPDHDALSPTLLADAMGKALRGEYGNGFLGPDAEQREIVAAWRYVPAISSGLAVAIDAEEVLVPVDKARRVILLVLGVLLLLATLIANLAGRRMVSAEDRLAAREAQYRSIFQSINDSVLVLRAVGTTFRLIDLNPAAERLIGELRAIVRGRDLAELLPGAERGGLIDCLRRVRERRRGDALPVRRYEDAARSIWLESDFHVLPNDDILAVFKDVTDRQRAADDISRSVLRLNEAQRIAKVGSWTRDLRTRRLEWSAQIFRMFELDPASARPSYKTFVERVHPDDRELVRDTYANSLSARRPYTVTYRLLLGAGRIRYVRERCETEFAADGTPLLSKGTVQDITHLREAEAEKLLYARAFEHSGEAMVITDPQERILAVNRAFTRHTGYSADEVLGRTPRLLASGNTPRHVYQEMWRALAQSGFWQGEVWDRRKDGSVYPKWLNISEVRDASGEVSHYVGSFIDTSERKASEEKIRFLAHHDPLTGLFNRSSLESRLDQAVRSARREATTLAVMFIDLDRFKTINDSLGHHVGDELLRVVAARLEGCMRDSDVVARLGGDEFVAVLAGLDGPLAAAAVAEKIIASLNEPYQIGSRLLRTSPSLGIAIYPDDGDDPTSLMKNADAAMYHAKRQGRNSYRYFSAVMSADASERLALEQELHTALLNREFVVHYQPQVDARSGALIGFEALVRWQHPQRGLVPPAKFIPIAEETGKIEEIGRWVLDESCRQLAAWRADGFAAQVRIAVNLSSHQLRSPSLVDEVRQVFRRYGLADGDLELEVTESAAMQDPEQAIDRLRILRDLGVHLAIDDFGTGYSSLAYLKLLPIHVLKLDRAFVRDLEVDDNDAAIATATISLAHSLGLRVVAEGVETGGQQAFLVAHGCDYLQGYRFGKPAPAAQVERDWRAAPALLTGEPG